MTKVTDSCIGDLQSSGSNKHTRDHIDCPVCSQALAVKYQNVSSHLSFSEAFDLWISSKIIRTEGIASNARYISSRAERDLRQYARALEKFFGKMPLEKIHLGHLREYHRARAVCDKSAGNWDNRAGANLIRKEMQTLIRVMKAAGVWTPFLEENFGQLQPVENDIPQALTPDQQHTWLHVAASRIEWQVVYWYSLAAFQTTAATNEMRGFRLGDIHLAQRIVQVRSEGAKNKFRIRTIPLESKEVNWAFERLVERACRLGADGPHCYLFPRHITRDRYDASAPMSVWGLRKSWDAVRQATGLHNFTPYDTRHTAITRMAEAGVPIQVIMSYAGHMSPKMQQHYTQISEMAKRYWGRAVWGGSRMLNNTGPQFEPPRFGPQPAHSWTEAVNWR